jgi:hypothetical protein
MRIIVHDCSRQDNSRGTMAFTPFVTRGQLVLHARRFSFLLIIIISILSLLGSVRAQTTPQAGDPPNAALISIAAADESGIVTVNGAAGAVFPTAQVVIRNLYTGDTVFTQAGVSGSFGAEIYGPGNTPFWISPTTDIPNGTLDQIGSLPGGPGTIVYGGFAQTVGTSEPVTGLVVDGEFVDWNAYTNSLTGQGVRVLHNQDALYIGFPDGFLLDTTAQIVITLTMDAAQFSLSMIRDPAGALTVTRLDPAVRELGTIGIASAGTTAVELRIRLAALNPDNPQPQVITIRQVEQRSASGASLRTTTVDEAALFVPERVGVVRNATLREDVTRFSISGSAAGDELRWSARAQLNSQDLNAGEALRLWMDVALDAPELPDGVIGLTLGARFYLQPVVDASGEPAAGGLYSNSGWTSRLTPSGMGIGNLRSDMFLGETITPTTLISRRGDQVLFPLDFEGALPEELPAGLYTLLMEGFGQVGDGERFSWQESSPLGPGSALPVSTVSRLPAVLKVGGVTEGRLLWSLFQDSPSSGVRGLLSAEDQAGYGLVNTVRYSSPMYIMPPSRNGEALTYPLEPYLLSMMPNRYDVTTAPLLPLLFPGGRLSARITRPDGLVDDLGSVPMVQNQLSTDALDEAEQFGSQSLVDTYRISTLNPLFSQYQFSQYGDYEIVLQGEMEDVWGNRYSGGGTYTVRIAEPLTISPAVLPGAPFTVGDVLAAGVRVSPGLPAQVRIRVQIFPLDGSAAIEQVIEGRANAHGYFAAPSPHLAFEQAGEYVIDYEVEYLDNNAQLWAGSLRSAGVVAQVEATVSARGDRGLANNGDGPRPAWFRAAGYAPDLENPILPLPFFNGDVLWLPDEDGLLQTTLTVQDADPAYQTWLNELGRVDADTLDRLRVESALPLEASLSTRPAEAYSYLSAVTAGFSVRQQVLGSAYGGALLPLNTDDPAAQQPGAGNAGLRPGDYVFLFGGSIQRQPAVSTPRAAGYAALAVITEPDDPLGPRVLPPYQGEAGGGNTGPLFTLDERPINLFFHPTGVVPGSILAVGDTFSVAGQFAPTLDSTLHVRITSPSGAIREFAGRANSTGYFYDPALDFTVLEAGLWNVELQGRHEGMTSNGQVENPAPTGDVLGTVDGRFSVYVLPTGTALLEWNDTRTDFVIPPGQPYNFRFTLPEGWTDAQFDYTVSIPGMVLEQGPIRVVGTSVTYQYNLGTLRQTFPMLEDGRSGDGPSAIDAVTLTFFASGTDSSGQRQRLGRSFTIAFDRLTTSG